MQYWRSWKKNGLDIQNCCGQGIDNGTSMVGINSGVKTQILSINPKESETQSQGVVAPYISLSLEEVSEAINKLKDNKASGPDTIPSELLKNGGKETSKKVYDLIQAILEQEVIPLGWKMSRCPRLC
ncbi:hypothetical protein TNCV_577341 [Trichonephila clavipes]|nr:hypothetical protein TNCV_577341 [Trichonephila clavipes]